MAIQTIATIKSYFLTGKKPTQQQFNDMIDTLSQTNVKTLVYIVGVAGVTGCNHNFTSVANTTQQSIQLGGTNIIAGACPVTQLTTRCIDGLNGGITGTGKLGLTTGSNTYMTLNDVDTTDDMAASGIGNVISASATSVWFSFTPSANWDTITNGKWKILITYVDNSNL